MSRTDAAYHATRKRMTMGRSPTHLTTAPSSPFPLVKSPPHVTQTGQIPHHANWSNPAPP
eukprot:3940780-Rhodomonas_salina.5